MFFAGSLRLFSRFEFSVGRGSMGCGSCGAQCHSLSYNSASVCNHESDANTQQPSTTHIQKLKKGSNDLQCQASHHHPLINVQMGGVTPLCSQLCVVIHIHWGGHEPRRFAPSMPRFARKSVNDGTAQDQFLSSKQTRTSHIYIYSEPKSSAPPG